MVHGLRQRHAHEAGRGEAAIEPRQLHHLNDGAHAGALVADPQCESAGEFDFARRVRAVAELVLQPLQPQRIDRAVGAKARHEEAGEPARGLRQHQERIAHRRGQKPFVSDDGVRVSRRRGSGNVGAHISAALLFRHAHAERHARLFPPGPEGRIVTRRGHFRRNLRKERRVGAERGQRGTRHGDRAQMPALDLRRHVIARRSRHFRRRRRALAGRRPGRGMQPRRNARPHQVVIGRMKFDDVAAKALWVKGVEFRRVLVGTAREREHLGRAPLPPERRERGCFVLGAIRPDGFLERYIARKQIDVFVGRRLVEYLLGVEARQTVHGNRPRWG